MYLFHTGIEKDPHTYEFYCRGCSFGMGFIFMLYFLNCMKRVLAIFAITSKGQNKVVAVF